MNAVIYARVSSTNDRQSTDRQVSDLNAYASKNDINVIRTFEEHISGAKRNEERPVLCECLDYCIENNVDSLLISELSRLGRNVDEVLANVKFCKDNKLNIYFQKENLSIFQADGTKNPFLNIFISVLGTCAEMERENIKFRLNSGRAKYIADGGKLGRKVGYRKPQEQKAKEYKNVLRELKKGTSIRRTAKLCDVSISTVQRLKMEFAI
jgi:DNA invertase Pin-like site-specific DNA recombinase